ncbi:hypothetical protein B0H34DRAFT_739356 [Crassisporium funariophilum]|nr:hypothetical protein B0H34DRAFT_739305 [Crassisporium funariophilum]KAF8147402.1 hypothetical protein B0H34DRAFT_739356 [Crassisporium funariophilum]
MSWLTYYRACTCSEYAEVRGWWFKWNRRIGERDMWFVQAPKNMGTPQRRSISASRRAVKLQNGFRLFYLRRACPRRGSFYVQQIFCFPSRYVSPRSPILH